MSQKISPVIGYKIAVINNANLNSEFVNEVRQFVRASKRQMRAVRKARLMGGRNQGIQLFGERKDGTHFPVSLRQRTVA
jgi:hypothetical protein